MTSKSWLANGFIADVGGEYQSSKVSELILWQNILFEQWLRISGLLVEQGAKECFLIAH